ncbi:MAG: phospholipase D-like domain-containing protein [Elusimicrobia bacterium]|nr:phospholipase D-like domain-containing protein [Elusimicrobiota bacterium]
MKVAIRALLLVFLAAPSFCAPPVSPPDFSAPSVERPASPAVPAPAYSALSYGSYDLSGLPAYVFTDEESLAAPIIKAIDRADRTLDVALYNLQIDEAAAALVRAKARGVKVRVIFDHAHVFPKAGPQIQAVIDSGIETRAMKGRGSMGTMHCKFAIFDRSLLETGSANWSGFAQDYSYENIMFTASRELIGGYQRDFDWLWGQSRPVSGPGTAAASNTPPPADPTVELDFNGTLLPDYIFSPRGGTEQAIVRAIDAARSEADVAMFTFTSESIMGALKRAAGRGVHVKLMVFAGQDFPFAAEARKSRMELRFKPGRGQDKGQMHNKFAVLDGRLLINGSFNWTNMAENSNTENTIFTMDPDYVRPYRAEFEKLYGTAKE